MTEQTLTPEEVLALAKSYADDLGVKLEIKKGITCFAADPKTRTLFIPDGKITADPIELVHGIRHEAIHLRITDPDIMTCVLEETETLYYVSQMLEDIRDEKTGARQYPGASSVNYARYHTKPFLSWKPKKGKPPTVSQYIFSLRHKGLFPRESLGFELDPRLLPILEEVARIPDCARQVKLMKKANAIVREVFKMDEEKPEEGTGNGEAGKEAGEGGEPGEGSPEQGPAEGPKKPPEAPKAEQASKPPEDKPEPSTGKPKPGAPDESEAEGEAPQVEEAQSGSAVKIPEDKNELGREFSKLKRLIEKTEALGANKIKVDFSPDILDEPTKYKLRDLVRAFGLTNSPEDDTALNADPFELALGIATGEPDLVFKGPECYEVKPTGNLIILLDTSGSMDAGISPNGPAISRLDYCFDLARELSALENENFQISLVQWSNRMRIVKPFGAPMPDKPYIALGGGTRPACTVKALEELAPGVSPGPTLILYITDGEWPVRPARIFEQAEEIIPGAFCGAIGIFDGPDCYGESRKGDQFENIAGTPEELSEFVLREIEKLERRMS